MLEHLDKRHTAWVLFLFLLACAYCTFSRTDWFASSVLITGVLCVTLIAIGRKEGYLFGLYNCSAYAWLAYENGLFGEVFLNLLFYVPTSIIGYMMWQKNQENQTVLMRKLSLKAKIKILGGLVVFIVVLGIGLSYFDEQKNPFVDATTNTLGICATFLMMYRYSEQWVFYILLNCITIILWALRYLDQGSEADTMIFMWILFLANSIYGYIIWMGNSKLETQKI